MSKKIIYVILGALTAIALGVLAFLMAYFKMGYESFMGAMIVMMSYGFLNIILLLVTVLNKHEIKRLSAAIYATIVAIGVLGYYILRYINHYEEGFIIYWSVYAGITIIAITVLVILNFKLAPQKPVMVRQK